MRFPSWLIHLDQIHSSYLVLVTLAVLALAGGVLLHFGLLGWLLGIMGLVIGWSIRRSFLLWERLLSWAPWPKFLAIVFAFLVVGALAGGLIPGLRVVCGLVPLLMGVVACLAYMFIDLERYEVERGHKAVHNPLQGQELAVHVARYGQQVGIPLLIAATVAVVCGFALLNQGLYETIGQQWYKVGDGQGKPIYVDFLAYALIKLLGIVDVLDLAQSNHVLQSAYVRPAQWPASTLLAGFKAFFTLVLLQQIFASLRQGKLLAETIADLWSPHQPIHERARNALPQYGGLAIGPLLVSLRSVPLLTREQRDHLPQILAAIGPSTIPALVYHLHDPHAHVRAIAAAALGHLHALDTVPLLAALGQDPSDVVRQSVVEALGALLRKDAPSRSGSSFTPLRSGFHWLFWWKRRGVPAPLRNPVDLAVATLESALADDSVAVRTQAALALGGIGPAAAGAAPGLVRLLKDADETVRCRAAEALGQMGAGGAAQRNGVSSPDSLSAADIAALVELLQDASAPVKASAARALGALRRAAASAVPALVPLLQDRDEAVRTAAAEAIAQVGPLNGAAIDSLVTALANPDTVVRAQTAEALGTIGATAEDAAPALVRAMRDGNDRVRAKAAEALGKIGESAAAAAVPSLTRALRDQDNWVSALAAEALGQMGESADGAIPALVRSLKHLNAQVRGNAAEALGKMAGAAAGARLALERAAQDEDGGARSQAIRALGLIGPPTPSSESLVLAGLQDADPLVRAAAVESVGQGGQPSAAVLGGLAPLLEDRNDQVKVAAIKVLPKLAGATPDVIDALCRRLLEDDNVWVQVHTALALGQLGPAAISAGGPLLRATQTGEVSVREQALRSLAMIQPPESVVAFTAGLEDSNADIRKVASAGWTRAVSIPEAAIPGLVAALRDPDDQVRANAAHALARLDSLPAEAVPLLIACTSDPSDGLRINAATALLLAPRGATSDVMQHLVEDANVRIRLIAASSLLALDTGHARAGAVLEEALSDPARRVRKGALDLVESLGSGGAVFVGVLKRCRQLEEDVELCEVLTRRLERFGNPAGTELSVAEL